MFFSLFNGRLDAHLECPADLHHITLLHHGDPEVIGLHELLQQSSVLLILTAWTEKKTSTYIMPPMTEQTTTNNNANNFITPRNVAFRGILLYNPD